MQVAMSGLFFVVAQPKTQTANDGALLECRHIITSCSPVRLSTTTPRAEKSALAHWNTEKARSYSSSFGKINIIFKRGKTSGREAATWLART